MAGGEREIIAQFQVVKLGTFWTQYKRIFQVTTTGITTVDPTNFKVTNFFEYHAISSLVSDESSDEQFTFTMAGGTSCTFKSAHRSQLLCQLMECATKASSPSMLFPTHGPFDVQRMRKTRVKTDAKLLVTSYGIEETDKFGKPLQSYSYVNISRYGTDDRAQVLFFIHSGRAKLFVCQELGR